MKTISIFLNQAGRTQEAGVSVSDGAGGGKVIKTGQREITLAIPDTDGRVGDFTLWVRGDAFLAHTALADDLAAFIALTAADGIEIEANSLPSYDLTDYRADDPTTCDRPDGDWVGSATLIFDAGSDYEINLRKPNAEQGWITGRLSVVSKADGEITIGEIEWDEAEGGDEGDDQGADAKGSGGGADVEVDETARSGTGDGNGGAELAAQAGDGVSAAASGGDGDTPQAAADNPPPVREGATDEASTGGATGG